MKEKHGQDQIQNAEFIMDEGEIDNPLDGSQDLFSQDWFVFIVILTINYLWAIMYLLQSNIFNYRAIKIAL